MISSNVILSIVYLNTLYNKQKNHILTIASADEVAQ